MTLALREIRLREIRLPLREPFTISSGTTTTRRILLAHLTDHDGTAVWAECVAGDNPNYSPETIDTSALALREWVAPRVLDREFADPSEIHPALSQDFRGHHMAKATIEMGMWALAATKRNTSLAAILEGTRSEVATGISLGIQASPEVLVEKASRAFDEGYRKVKIKIMPGADIEYIRAAREALPGRSLMADANNAYTSADIDHLAQLDAFDLLMIEQPLAWDDVVRHADLQRRLRTPICLDESITGVDRAADMIALGSGRIVNVKPGRVGGFAVSRAIHDLCAGNDVPVWCGGMLESGVGRAYNVALASLPNFTLPGDVSPSARYWEHDIVTPEWTMDGEGMVTVPRDVPGIGVDVDTARVDALTTREDVLRA